MDNRRAVLVYQVGIANIFEVDCFNDSCFGRNAKQLLQSDFNSCENFARRLAQVGYLVCSLYCNQAGDIINANWKEDLNNAPFSDKFNPVFKGVLTDYNYHTIYQYSKPI
jgi:hypothetical protein